MKIKELLREYNEQRLINDFGNKILSKAKTDISAPKTNDIKDILTKITAMDPTPNKELTFWCALNYANNGITRFEDIGKAMNALEDYKKLLRKPNLNPPLQIRDINQIRGLVNLEKIVDQYPKEEIVSNKEAMNQEEQGFYESKEATLLYNSDQIKVVIPNTKKASIFFGKGTKWCTAATNNNMFSNYSKKNDPLYIIMIKGSNEKYQFHFGTKQFMDISDKEINPQELANKYQILYKIFEPIAIKHLYLPLIKNPSEAVQLAAVKQNVWAIDDIKNPSEAMQLAAVNQNGDAIQYIKNPSEDVKLAAVQQDARAIRYIKNPSEAMQLAAVNRYGGVIRYIKKPSEDVQLAAVNQDGHAIKYIKNPSEDVQLAAVNQNGNVIRFIKKPTISVQMMAKLLS